MGSTRRRFLKFGLGGVILLAVPGVGLGLRPSVLVEPAAPLRTFNQRQFSVLAAVAETMCPGAAGLPSAGDLGVAEALDHLYSRMDPTTGKDIGAILDLLENALAGALLDGRVRTFTACSPEQRREVLDAWRTSAISVRRAIFKALRGFVMAAYWGDRRTWDFIGYGGMPDYTKVPSPMPFDAYIASLEAAKTPEQPAEETP